VKGTGIESCAPAPAARRDDAGPRRVLLVYPEFPDTYWSFRHALSFVGKRSAFPPLGLLTVSAMLPATWERRLVDLNVGPLADDDLAWADLVFVSAMMVQKDSLDEVVARAKARGKRVAVGGPYVSTAPDAVPHADHVFVGEAEETVPQFLADLAAGEPRRTYRVGERPALSLTPVADFGLVERRRYSSMSIQYSRGCPFQCEFCDIIEVYGRVPRTKSNAQVLAELDALFAAGWRGLVFVVDDNFIGNKKNVKRLLPELERWSERNGRPFVFATEASVNLADDDGLLDLMRRAGFTRVFLGIETPVVESLNEAQKGQNTKRDLVASVRKIQSYGIEVMAGFIVGFDNDPENIFDLQVEFIRESAIPLAMVGLLTALPDTQLWRRLKREGRLLAESSGNNTDGSLNFVPKMDAGDLVDGYKSVLRAIYGPAEYYDRALASLERVARRPPTALAGPSRENVVALARVAFALGVRDGARRDFWKYLFRVALDHRDQFGHAVTLAAMGYHFRKHTEVCCGDAANGHARVAERADVSIVDSELPC
jgi:radical SAM superfamily enzyme YgiQ (UPF0313 family)